MNDIPDAEGGGPPMDAGLNFYSDPRTLTDEMIDPLIRKAVFRINESGWIWTAESCQGHPGDPNAWAGNERPMIRVVCHRSNTPEALEWLYRAAKYKDASANSGYSATGLTIWPYPRQLGWWDEFIVYISGPHSEALATWERFAEAVCSARRPRDVRGRHGEQP